MKNRTEYKFVTFIVFLLFLAVGIILFLVSSSVVLEHPNVSLILQNIAATLFIATAISIIWEYYGKNVFLKEITDAISNRIQNESIGIYDFSMRMSEIPWNSYFKSSNKIDIFVVYAKTWRKMYEEDIKDVVLNCDACIRVVFPNYNNIDLMAALSSRIHKTPDALIERIRGSIDFFKEVRRLALCSDCKGCVSIFLTNYQPLFGYFRFNDRVVLTFYSHDRKRDVPHFIAMNPGYLFNFSAEQFDSVLNSEETMQLEDNKCC